MPDRDLIWCSDALVPSDDRGYQFGDGVFETLLIHDGRIWLQERHLARLKLGLERLGMPDVCAQADQLMQQMAHHANAPWCVGKLVASRSTSGRGYGSQGGETRLTASLYQAEPWPEQPPTLRTKLAKIRLAGQPALAGLKHLNRLEQVLARAEADVHTFGELIVCDQAGYVVEAVASNLFVVKDGAISTPELSTSGVSGTARAHLMAYADITEAHVTLDDLAQADEVFLTNSVRGVQIVGEFHDDTTSRRYANREVACWAGRLFRESL